MTMGGNQIRIAWNQSTDRLNITIPDKIHFESTEAWVWLRDQSTVVVSPDKPVHIPHAEKHGVGYDATRRERRVQHNASLTGGHFRSMPTTYKVEGKALYITIPAPEQRLPPVERKAKPIQTAPIIAQAVMPPAEQPKPSSNGHGMRVKVLIAWTEFGLPDDAVLEIPIEAAKELAKSYGGGSYA